MFNVSSSTLRPGNSWSDENRKLLLRCCLTKLAQEEVRKRRLMARPVLILSF